MILCIQFFISFCAVFLKGIQHQNVIGGKYVAASVVSFMMAVFDVAVVSFIVMSGWWSILPIAFGATLGITSSMYLYRKSEALGYCRTFMGLFK